jgi:hypothetical protein
MVRFVYYAFGLRLCTNLPLKGLLPLGSNSADDDLQIWLKAVPPWLKDLPDAARTIWHISSYPSGEPWRKVWKVRDGTYFWFLYDDGTQFILDRFGTEVWATWLQPMTLEDAATYLLGPILGFVLRLRGFVTLHASAVSIGEAAIALVGPQGAGKSTTAAALGGRGHAVLSDDIVALRELDDSLLIQPAYPQLKLWPNSVEALYGTKESLPLLTPNYDKHRLDLINNGYRFQQAPLRVGLVYFLAPRSNHASAPYIEDLSPQDGLIALLGNGYVTVPVDKQMRAREFDLLGRIAARVPMRKLTPHVDPVYLPKLCEVILEDCQQLRQH